MLPVSFSIKKITRLDEDSDKNFFYLSHLSKLDYFVFVISFPTFIANILNG